MKWVLFDAYGTLFDAGKYNIKIIAEEIAGRFGLDSQIVFDMWTTKYVELENNYDRGFQTITETNRESLAFLFEKLDLGEDYEFYVKRMNDEWSTPKLLPGVLELVEWLKEQCCHIGIVSNSDDITLMAAVENSALSIDNIVSSEMAKSYKPDSKIFEFALNKWNCTPEQCIYIGNSKNDVMASTSVGIECIYLQSGDYNVCCNSDNTYQYHIKSILECVDCIKMFLGEYNIDDLRNSSINYEMLYLNVHKQKSIDKYFSDGKNMEARGQALSIIKNIFPECPQVYQELYLEPSNCEELRAVALDYWFPGGYGNTMSYGMNRFKVSSYEEYVVIIVFHTIKCFLGSRDFAIMIRWIMRTLRIEDDLINKMIKEYIYL